MRLTIAAVGRAKAGPERTLYEHYAARITFPLSLREVEEKKPLKRRQLMRREGDLLLSAVPAGARLVALDERGQAVTSTELAGRLRDWRDDGVREVVFAIGSADGLDDIVRRKADLTLAFGHATWPHMLVRGLLAEQLYRAQCILSDHPYHRDG